MRRTDKFGRSLDAWFPPDTAEEFVHSSINYCDEMDTHNIIHDYDAVVTGTTGETTDTPLTNIATRDFDTKWQAEAATPDNNQYFELELPEARDVDSYIMNFHVPYPYTVAPYTPDMDCWKTWTLKGKLNAGDAWTTLETVTANAIKFYRGTFTPGEYKYFRVDGISAYSDQAQTARIDAYLYTMGLYDSTTKWNDAFPDSRRGRNDLGTDPENVKFANCHIYIDSMTLVAGDVRDINGSVTKVIKGEHVRRWHHYGEIQSEFCENSQNLRHDNAIKLTRMNGVDLVENTGIVLYLFPPPDEIWWLVSSGYAFDDTTDNLNTPIFLKGADNCHKLSPSWSKYRAYTSFCVLGTRYPSMKSGTFKTNKLYLAFSDDVNDVTMEDYDGQEGTGIVVDMNGTAITIANKAMVNANIARLKIGDLWRCVSGTHTFDPPIKLDGDVATDLFETLKNEKVKGSVFSYTLHGFLVPK
ncbi:MAG: hypothetical protein U9R15_01485 [Chloroflexota bacterium]|nr:hypothetical protein [Chloroflexota bacterium]